jgi:hypothetical protein
MQFSIVLLLLIAFVFPMYFVIRMVSNAVRPDGRETTLGEDVPEMNSNDDQRANQVIWETPRNPEGTLQGLNKLISRFGIINVTKTVTIGEPTVVKMESDVLQQARDLHTAGKDMDSICREINPEYSRWGSTRQMLFRKTMETMLSSLGQTTKG